LPLTAAEWREDFHYLVERIRSIHPNPYREVSSEVFDRTVARIETNLAEMSPAEAVVAFLRVLALTRDGHTTVPLGFAGFGDDDEQRAGVSPPAVRLYDFEDGLTVVATTHEWRNLLGSRIQAIGGVPRLGYRVLGEGAIEGALEVFRLIVEHYPDSANAHDSYGEALWRAGDIEAAREQYERAVELDPNGFVGRHARSMLERIRAGQPPP